MLFAILTYATLIAARSISLPAIEAKLPDASCTFTLWHRQQASLNYIQLNTISDHANSLRIDVAAQRSTTKFNSYTRLDDNHAFAVTGLLDDSNLTISYAPEDELRFKVGDVQWSTHRSHGGAGCNAQDWEGSADSRERELMCLFPCEKVADDDGYAGIEGGEGQVEISLQ